MTDRRDKKYKGTSSSERVGRKEYVIFDKDQDLKLIFSDSMEISRSRSPSLISRLRERTPSKTTSTSMMDR